MVLATGMLLGRLELFAVLVLFFRLFGETSLWKFIKNNHLPKLSGLFRSQNDKNFITWGYRRFSMGYYW